MRTALSLFGAVWLFAAPAALADEIDPAALYTLSTQGSSSVLKVGEKGKLVVAIAPKANAHVSAEAPLKMELSGKGVKPDKERLTLADAVGDKAAPRFEVPLTAEQPGKAEVDAKLTFFICTDKICSRQQKTLSVPVVVK